MKLLSIVTATFNRAAYLRRCFASLLAQTDRRFEWIVVDDGSTDETPQTVEEFRAQTAFRVTYCREEHKGKHAAMNTAHPFIHGDYVLVLDDDDRLVPNAVEEIHKGWDRHDRPEIGILIFLEGYSEDDPFARGEKEHVPFDMYRNHTKTYHSRDCCDIYRAEPFLKYPFPVFPGETFLSESILWNRMAADYQIVYINQVIYLADYLENGLTRSGRAMRVRVPRGGMFAANLYLDRRYPIKQRLKNGLLYNCYSLFAKEPFRAVRSAALSKPLTDLTRPGGWLLYVYWKRKYG